MHRTPLAARRAVLPRLLLASAVAALTACSAGAEPAADEAAQTAGRGVFDGDAPALDLRLEVPLEALIVRDELSSEDFPQTKGDVEVKGTLTAPSLGLLTPTAVRVKTRGNTSLFVKECGTFPKLKVELVEKAAGTAFSGSRSFKIATHCGELSPKERTPFGRVANEVAPWREAAAYRMLAALGVNVPRARPVSITYVDTSKGNETLSRKAALIEDIDDVAKRLGGKEIDQSDDPEEESTDAIGVASLDPTEAALVHLGEALLGNLDYRLNPEGETWFIGPNRPEAQSFTWNMKGVRVSETKEIAVPVDFDLSSMVAPSLRPARVPEAFSGSDPDLQRQLHIAMGSRTRVSRAGLDGALAIARSAKTKAALERVASAEWLDEEGRAAARRLVAGFVALTATDASFFTDVVTAEGVEPLTIDGEPHEACSDFGEQIPVGTPIHRWNVFDDKLGLEQISLLDVRMQLPCNEPRVWVKKGTVTTTKDFPAP